MHGAFRFDVGQAGDRPGCGVLHFLLLVLEAVHGVLEHPACLGGENTERHLQLGDGFIQVGVFVELLP